MKDLLAFILIVIILIVITVMLSGKTPDNAVSKTICSNITCYYEIKDQK